MLEFEMGRPFRKRYFRKQYLEEEGGEWSPPSE